MIDGKNIRKEEEKKSPQKIINHKIMTSNMYSELLQSMGLTLLLRRGLILSEARINAIVRGSTQRVKINMVWVSDRVRLTANIP